MLGEVRTGLSWYVQDYEHGVFRRRHKGYWVGITTGCAVLFEQKEYNINPRVSTQKKKTLHACMR